MSSGCGGPTRLNLMPARRSTSFSMYSCATRRRAQRGSEETEMKASKREGKGERKRRRERKREGRERFSKVNSKSLITSLIRLSSHTLSRCPPAVACRSRCKRPGVRHVQCGQSGECTTRHPSVARSVLPDPPRGYQAHCQRKTKGGRGELNENLGYSNKIEKRFFKAQPCHFLKCRLNTTKRTHILSLCLNIRSPHKHTHTHTHIYIYIRSLTHSHRAATSVVTRQRNLPSRKFCSVSSRCFCAMSPCSACASCSQREAIMDGKKTCRKKRKKKPLKTKTMEQYEMPPQHSPPLLPPSPSPRLPPSPSHRLPPSPSPCPIAPA